VLQRRRVVNVGCSFFLDGLEGGPLSTSDDGKKFVLYFERFRMQATLCVRVRERERERKKRDIRVRRA